MCKGVSCWGVASPVEHRSVPTGGECSALRKEANGRVLAKLDFQAHNLIGSDTTSAFGVSVPSDRDGPDGQRW